MIKITMQRYGFLLISKFYAPAHSLFERVSAQLQGPSKPPRNFSDYQLSINQDDLPAEINLIRRL